MRLRFLAGSLVFIVIAAGCSEKKVPEVRTESLRDTLERTDLIPRTEIFGNPDRADVQLSPDGRVLSFLAPEEGVLNVWMGPADNPAAAIPMTKERRRGVHSHFWAYNGSHVVYVKDHDGDENWRMISLDTNTGEEKVLTPESGVQAQLVHLSPKYPDEILVALNERDPKYHDIYRINVVTGDKRPVLENNSFSDVKADDDFTVRIGIAVTSDGGNEFMKPDGNGGWKSFMKVPAEDTAGTGFIDFHRSGRHAYMVDSRGRERAGLYLVDLDSLQSMLVAENDKADITGAMFHPTQKTLQVVEWEYLRDERKVIDPTLDDDFIKLRELGDGDIDLTSRSLDDQHWIVKLTRSDSPIRYYLYDRPEKKATFLFVHRTGLEGRKLARMRPVVIKSRDGMELVSYLTLPASEEGRDIPVKPLPTVIDVHGGPWARDSWGYVPEHQWLASRGYAVLSINFRGSTGFGKTFVNAADHEWGRRMHYDILDAVGWAVENGISDPKKVAVMGWSYGGYETLVGMSMTPEVFACGVDGVGPSNLVTLMETIPPYWMPAYEMFVARIGDPRNVDGRKFLNSRSPIHFVDQIKKPLLIGQGVNDPRVKRTESDQIVYAMKARRIPVVYALYPDEGHGFHRPENRLSFYAMAEVFLSNCLGGFYQPIGGDFKGSSVKVMEGDDLIPGLKNLTEAAQANKQKVQAVPD
jgi:dipeptidyl aminopeptidase/acylaminoacyl peptidase